MIQEKLASSFNLLCLGLERSKHMHENAACAKRGEQGIAGGWRGCLYGVRGDWAFHRETFHFVRHYNLDECCHLCNASQQNSDFGMNAYNLSPTAAHRGTLFSETELARQHGTLSPLTQVVGFKMWHIWFDWFHTMELGIISDCIASALLPVVLA
jgi:hypothetical protein